MRDNLCLREFIVKKIIIMYNMVMLIKMSFRKRGKAGNSYGYNYVDNMGNCHSGFSGD